MCCRCLDPMLSLVSLLSAKKCVVHGLVYGIYLETGGADVSMCLTHDIRIHRSPFILPLEKKDQANRAKLYLAGEESSDHRVRVLVGGGWCVMAGGQRALLYACVHTHIPQALLAAYEGWKEAERRGQGRDFCWRNFLSAATLRMVHAWDWCGGIVGWFGGCGRRLICCMYQTNRWTRSGGSSRACCETRAYSSPRLAATARRQVRAFAVGLGCRMWGWDLGDESYGTIDTHYTQIMVCTAYFNAHSSSWPVVKAALLAGLYPNVVCVLGVGWWGCAIGGLVRLVWSNNTNNIYFSMDTSRCGLTTGGSAPSSSPRCVF